MEPVVEGEEGDRVRSVRTSRSREVSPRQGRSSEETTEVTNTRWKELE